MKKLLCLTLLVGLISVVFAQKPQEKSALQSPLQSMVDTERAFARMSEEQGTRPAFMAFIADDGILFRPRAVKGKQWMTEHPLPPSDKRPLLSWYPAVADIARIGDLGYTTGPWEYKADIHDAAPVAWGNFLTVWKRQPDRSWKFVIDLGISNPKPNQPATPWQLPNNYIQLNMGSTRDVTADTIVLLARDREFSAASATGGARAAFAAYAAPEVRVFRDEKFPFVGREAATAALPTTTTVWTWEPAAGDVSHSGDLGYTHGTYRLADSGPVPKIIESGNYFRIWKMDNSGWKVLFDLTNPIPPEPNKN